MRGIILDIEFSQWNAAMPNPDPKPQQPREEPPRHIADELDDHKELLLALQRELGLII
jgi:hypothetical protein